MNLVNWFIKNAYLKKIGKRGYSIKFLPYNHE